MSKRSDQAGPGDWIAERLHGLAEDVGSVVPDGFPAYVRLLHPARRSFLEEKVRWSELGPVDAGTQFEYFDVRDPTLDDPDTGGLPADELAALVEVLAEFTRTATICWFGVWEGYGVLDGPPAVAALRPLDPADAVEVDETPPPAFAGRLEAPEREYLLRQGPIEEALALAEWLGEGPNLWWPEDRAWVVASDIDLPSTYVAGSVELAERLVADGRLEALRVELGSPISLDPGTEPPR